MVGGQMLRRWGDGLLPPRNIPISKFILDSILQIGYDKGSIVNGSGGSDA